MDIFIKMIMVALCAAFLENTIFEKAFGSSTMLMVTKDKKAILPFGLSITYFCSVTSLITYFTDGMLKNVENNFLYYPIVYVLVIGIVYILTLLFIWKFFYKLFMKTKVFMHMAAFNCAVLGALFINNLSDRSLLGYVIYGFGTGIGFFIATIILSACHSKLTSREVPESFRGFPAIMLYIGIISMAFFALVSKGPVL